MTHASLARDQALARDDRVSSGGQPQPASFTPMSLLSLRAVSIAFGGPPVLDRADFGIERGERVCLLGRNGAGKTTVMKLLDRSIAPDGGEVVWQTGITVTRLAQEIPDDVAGTTFDVVTEGLGTAGVTMSRYAASGGRKRQTLLAQALVRQPDGLLLDEPTNHLDVDAIEWMEEFLIGRGTTLLFVTHDRAFLRRLATRIVELDRGRLVDWGGDYDTYLERKEGALAAEAREWTEFDKKLAKEEVWIRTGIQARRTR